MLRDVRVVGDSDVPPHQLAEVDESITIYRVADDKDRGGRDGSRTT